MLTRGEQLLIDRRNFALRTRKKAVPNKNRLTFKQEHEEALRLYGEAKAAALERLNTFDSIVEADAILLGLTWDAEGYVNIFDYVPAGEQGEVGQQPRRIKVILREKNATTSDNNSATSDSGTEAASIGV